MCRAEVPLNHMEQVSTNSHGGHHGAGAEGDLKESLCRTPAGADLNQAPDLASGWDITFISLCQ